MTDQPVSAPGGEIVTAVGSTFEGPEYERLPPRVWWLSAVMVLIGIVTFILMSLGDRFAEGYLYLFFYSIPANTAISVFPHEPVLIWYGKFANLWVSAAAATGGTLVAGFLDHRVFVPVLNYQKISAYKQNRFYKRATALFMKYPFATILVTGFTPIPFFPFKFLCFSIHYPLDRYLLALSVARFPRYFLLAWIGAAFGIPTWILILSVVVIFGLYAIRGGPALVRRLRAWWEMRRGRKVRSREAAKAPQPTMGEREDSVRLAEDAGSGGDGVGVRGSAETRDRDYGAGVDPAGKASSRRTSSRNE